MSTPGHFYTALICSELVEFYHDVLNRIIEIHATKLGEIQVFRDTRCVSKLCAYGKRHHRSYRYCAGKLYSSTYAECNIQTTSVLRKLFIGCIKWCAFIEDGL